MSTKIVVVGSLNLDLVANVPRMPLEGETLTGLRFATYPGGKGANQAVAAAKLGGDVQMIGRVGDDAFAATLRNGMHETGVDTSPVRNVPGPSGSAIILVTSAGHNAIVVTPGANATLTPENLDLEREALGTAGILLAQLEIPLETVERLGEIAHALGIPLILDPAPAQKLSNDLLEKVTWLTPNESETRILLRHLGHSFGDELGTEEDFATAADLLLASGVRNVVLKLGERGVCLAGLDVESVFIPSHRVNVLDTTAAGDAFNGGFAYALTSGMSPTRAAKFACAVAAISVTRSGAQPSMPTFEEVAAFLAEHTTVVAEG